MLVHYDGDGHQASASPNKQTRDFCLRTTPAVIVMMKTRTSLIIILWILFANCVARSKFSSSDFLSLGDSFLASEDIFGAIEHYKRAISLLDGSDSPVVVISLYTNLGTALSSIGKNPEAADSYKAAIMVYSEATEVPSPAEENEGDIVSMRELGDIAAQASFYLGMVLQDMGDFNKAAKAYSYAGILDPYHWASFSNLGALLQDEFRDYSGAIVTYSKAYDILTQLDVEPTDAPFEPRYIVSQLKYRIGMALISSPDHACKTHDYTEAQYECKELAANALLTAIKHDPDNEGAKHMLASLTADATVKRASNAYVEALFENYAVNFEKSLVDDLKYDGYMRLRKAFNSVFRGSEIPSFHLVIDGGCGTGLVGEQFRNISEYLVGVDLSPAIIEQANLSRPGLYNETKTGDIIDVFRAMKPVNLIISADSYIYFGDLHPLFESIAESLAMNGYAAFTLEDVDIENEVILNSTNPAWRWMLTPTGRFAHRAKYVEEVGNRYSLHTVYYEHLSGFRFENGVPVRGHIFVMQKVEEQEL